MTNSNRSAKRLLHAASCLLLAVLFLGTGEVQAQACTSNSGDLVRLGTGLNDNLLINDAAGNFGFGPITQSLGQSFLAGCTGKLVSIEVEQSAGGGGTGTVDGTVKLYHVNGAISTEVGSAPYSLSPTGSGWQTVVFSTPVDVTAGETYGFFFFFPPTTNAYARLLFASSNGVGPDPYADGAGFWSSTGPPGVPTFPTSDPTTGHVPGASSRHDMNFSVDLEPPSSAIIVNSTADTATAGDGACTLREAISNSNIVAGGDSSGGDCAAGLEGLDTIEFAISGAVPHTIAVASTLPLITGPVIIDGCSEPDADCAGGIGDYDLEIVLDGSALASGDGLLLDAGSTGSIIRGLVIHGFPQNGIRVKSADNRIEKNYIGTDVSGTVDVGVGSSCVELQGPGATSNEVSHNLLSGCDFNGVYFEPGAAPGPQDNIIDSNYIGTTSNGRGSLPNNANAVDSNQADRNTISNNVLGGRIGLFLGADEFTIVGNYIGTNSFGDVLDVPGNVGVLVNGSNNSIGGTSLGEGNTFGALGVGIEVSQGAGNAIRRNSYSDNIQDIVLAAGANADQNPPEISVAELVDGSDLRLVYSIDIQATPVEVELLADGEYLDLGSYPTDTYWFNPGGMNRYRAYAGAENQGARLGAELSAIATDQNGNSSRISTPVTITATSVLTEFHDEFDDGELTTNTQGAGSGFISVGSRPVTESGGVASFAGTDNLTRVMDSRDAFDPFTGDPTVVTWEIEALGSALPNTTNETWVGIRPAAPSGASPDLFVPGGNADAEGVYIAINHDPASAGNPSSTSHGVVASRFPGGVLETLAEFEWTNYDGQGPLTVSLKIEGSSYAVAFSEPVNEDPVGSLSGTLPDAPTGGKSYVAAVNYKNAAGSPGTMTLDAVHLGSPLVVTNTDDRGFGSLRWAIAFANNNPGEDTITFDIEGGGPHVIALDDEPLPAIEDETTIDGLTQSGATCGNQEFAGRYLPIVIDGFEADPSGIFLGGGGVWIKSGGAGSTVRGLEIRRSKRYGINVSYANDVTIQCNNVGVGPSGTLGNTLDGIFVDGSRRAIIGGTSGMGNLVAGNGRYELYLRYRGDHVIEGNYFGASPLSGTPTTVSTDVVGGTDSQTVRVEGSGGTYTNNVIGGPSTLMVLLGDTTPAPGDNPRDEPSTLLGNYLGTDRTSTYDLSGIGTGIQIANTGNIDQFAIGGPNTGDGNVIRSMGTIGILVQGGTTGFIEGNTVTGNAHGIEVGSTGTWVIEDNDLISNLEDGVRLVGGAGHEVRGNTIILNQRGVVSSHDVNGAIIDSNLLRENGVCLPVLDCGTNAIEILGGSGHFVTDNDIFDNGYAGIWLADGANNVTVSGNKVGNNADSGIVITERDREGSLTGNPAFGNTVISNVSGLDAAGEAYGNDREGLAITFGAYDNVVTGNTFSANGLSGVVLWEAGENNQFYGNFIGTELSLTRDDLGNTQHGIIIGGVDNDATTVVGSPALGDGNAIAHNALNGILLKYAGDLDMPGFQNATISGNSIYANGLLGIDLSRATDEVAPDGNGPTGNDTNDFDIGPNGLQNYPSLVRAKKAESGTVSLDFRLLDGASYRVEVFAADADAQEGRSLLFSELVSDAEIEANQDTRVEFDGTTLGLGAQLVATATANGFTSEFSPPVTVDDYVPRGYTAENVVSLGTTASPRGVAAASSGDFLVASGSVVTRYDVGGDVLSSTDLVTGPGPVVVDDIVLNGTTTYVIHSESVQVLGAPMATSVPDVQGGAMSPDGKLYLVAGSRVLEFGDGTAPFAVYASLPTDPMVGSLETNALEFAGNGDLYVAVASGEVLRLPAGNPSAVETIWTVDGSPSALAFAEDGRLYLTTQKQVLFGLPSEIAPREFMALPGGGGNPNSLAIGPNSRLFVAHEATGQVLRFALSESQDIDGPSPLEFRLSPSLAGMLDALGTDVVDAAVKGALVTWEGVGGVSIAGRVTYDDTTPGVDRAAIGDFENTITLSNDRLFLGNATLGVASKLLRVRIGAPPEEAEVVTADILLNSRFHPVTGTSGELGVFTNQVSAKDHDVQGVLVHEFGHVLGLVHSGRPDASMFYNLPRDARTLTVDDRAAIRRQLDAPTAGFGTIQGQVTSGKLSTFGDPVGGALVIATNTVTNESIHAYSDRNGQYSLSYLPQPGVYILALYALDGSVFASKIPITPARISRYLDTIANERDFLEEYWNGVNESANDDRNSRTEITLGAAVQTANFVTNIDTTPPSVKVASVGIDPNAASLNPTIGITFSERVRASSVNGANFRIRPSICAAPCEPQSLVVSIDKIGRKVAVAKTSAPLDAGSDFVVMVDGLIDDAGNQQLTGYELAFSTREADTTAPVVSVSSPDNGARVSTGAVFTVTFEEALASTSVETVVLRHAGTLDEVLGAALQPSSNVVSFKPDRRLLPNTDYELVLNSVTDVSGNAFTGSSIFFTTEFDTPLVVDAIGPDAGATTTPESNIFIDFSKPVAALDVYPVELTLTQGGTLIDGAAELTNDGTRLVFIPALPLGPEGYTFTVTDASQFTDAATASNALDGGVVLSCTQTVLQCGWNFSVASESPSFTNISPRTASIGAFITLEGTAFDPSAAAVTFSDGGAGRVSATEVTGNANALTVRVPDGAGNGPVQVNGISTTDPGNGVFSLYLEPETFDTALETAETDANPSDVEVSPDGTIFGPDIGAIAVVPNSADDTVSLIDVESGESKSVNLGALGESTPVRVSLTPNGEFAYVTNFNSHTVSYIDLVCAWQELGGCVEPIKVGTNPLGIDVSPDGSRIFVANYSSKTVSVIDGGPTNTTFNSAVRTIETDEVVTDVFTNPDGTVRWLVSEANQPETELDPDGALGKLKSDSSPTDVEAHPDGTGVWIGTNFGVMAVEVNLEIDQADWGVTVMVSDSHPSASEVDPDGGVTKLETESAGSSTQTDPDGAGTITRTDDTVSAVESNPDGSTVQFVMGSGELLIYAVPTAPFGGEYQALAKTGTDANASDVATSPDGSLLYVTSYATNTVSIYAFGPGLSSAESDPLQVAGSDYGLVLIEVIDVGPQPEGVVYSPENNIAIVANSGSAGVENDGLTVINFTGESTAVFQDPEPVEIDANGDGIPDSRVEIADQLAMLFEESSGKDKKDYKKAAKHAAENLEDKLWTADATASDKHGNKVFDNDKQIIKQLEAILERDGDTADEAFNILARLITLDQLLVQDAIDAAQDAIDDLRCADGEAGEKCRKQAESALKEILKAVEDFEKGEAHRMAGEYDKAIDDYKKAWRHATKSADEVAGKGAIWENEEDLPIEFDLSPNYPNPFNPVTTIEFALPEMAEVRLEVFDVLGRRVQTLVNGQMDAGYHSVQFNAERLASGIYLYRIQAGAYSKVHRMVLMK